MKMMRKVGLVLASMGIVEAFTTVPLRSDGVRFAGSSLSVRRCSIPVLATPLSAKRRNAAQLQMNLKEKEQDELIWKLASIEPLNLPTAASQNIKEISNPAFFMRIASLSDQTEDESTQDKLAALASNLVAALEVVVQRTEERMDDSADVVQQVLAAAAQPNGEFLLPLLPERVAAMRAALLLRRAQVDEAVLSCLFAYMKKAGEDGLDGMVSIFQTMLQQWAAIELLEEARPGNAVLEKMLRAGADSWDAILQEAEEGGALDTDDLLAAVQACVEKVVLQKASGSYGQRVQAEFLREVMARIRLVAK